MRLIAILCLSLLTLPSVAHAADLERQEHAILIEMGRSVIEAVDHENYQAAVAQCEKARPLAGSDHYLLGLIERCLGWAERATAGAAHVSAACAHFSHALSLWQPALPQTGDSKQVELRKTWLKDMVTYRSQKGC